MSRNPIICRICLSMNVRMFSIAGTPLQTMYEKITDTPLHTADMRPETACYICYAQLNKCYMLMMMATKSENILMEILVTYPEVSTRSAALISYQSNNLSLTTIPVEYFDTSSFITSSNGDIDQDCVKLKKEPDHEVVEYDECMEPEMTEYDINIVKCESDTDADNLWKTGDEEPQLDIDVKIEVQKDIEKGEISPVWDTEDQTEEPLEREKEGPKPDSTLPRIYQCKSCLRVYTNRTSYRKHLDTHQTHECSVCKHRFSTRNNLLRHFSTHSEDKPYQCQVCKRRFRLKDYLKRHKVVHSKEQLKNDHYKCDVCRRSFRQKSALTAHMRTHTGEKPFECDICQKRFAAKFNLQNHVRMHLGEKPFRCDMCEARFVHRSSLRQHVMTHTGEKPHKCSVCRRGFTQSSHLKDHFKSHSRESL